MIIYKIFSIIIFTIDLFIIIKKIEILFYKIVYSIIIKGYRKLLKLLKPTTETTTTKTIKKNVCAIKYNPKPI